MLSRLSLIDASAHLLPCCAMLCCAKFNRNYLAEDEDAPFDGSLLAADKRCFGAFQLRYGAALSRPLYTRLLLAGSQLGDQEEERD